MNDDEYFIESIGDGCLQVVFGGIVFFTVLVALIMLMIRALS